MNRVTLQGRLGRDPELFTTASTGRTYARFSIATNEYIKGKSVTTWHRVVCFGRTAEALAKYCQKGRELTVDGKISYSTYEKDGETRYSTSIVANRIEYGRKPQSKSETQSQQAVEPIDAAWRGGGGTDEDVAF